MTKKIKNIIFTFTTLIFVMFGVLVVGSSHVNAASCSLTTSGNLPSQIFVPWYKYLDGDDASGKCTPTTNDDWTSTVSKVGLALIELLVRVSGLIVVGYMIWGGIQYTTSQGEPTGLQNAKSTITNAVVGFIIVIISVGFIQFIGNMIK